MKVVADTNVLVSALIFPGGPPEAFYRLALEGKIELVTSRPLLAELARVLNEKFGWQPERAQELIEQLIRLGEIVDPKEPIVEIDVDPTDNRVLEAALEGHADAIVSGDQHLLALTLLARNHYPTTGCVPRRIRRYGEIAIVVHKKAATTLLGDFAGNGFVKELSVGESEVFVMPGPYENADKARATLETLRSHVSTHRNS